MDALRQRTAGRYGARRQGQRRGARRASSGSCAPRREVVHRTEGSAHRRTTFHCGYEVSHLKRKLVEQVLGWLKAVGWGSYGTRPRATDRIKLRREQCHHRKDDHGHASTAIVQPREIADMEHAGISCRRAGRPWGRAWKVNVDPSRGRLASMFDALAVARSSSPATTSASDQFRAGFAEERAEIANRATRPVDRARRGVHGVSEPRLGWSAEWSAPSSRRVRWP